MYQQGEAAHEFYYVQAGLIGLFHTLENGKESLVRLYSKGDYFGFRTLFSMTDKHYHCNAKVLIDAEITRIKPNVVSEFFTHNTVMSQCLLQILADELREAEETFGKKVPICVLLDRVMDSLYFLKQHFPDYNWTYREIAEYAGCETETAIRYCKRTQTKWRIRPNIRS